MPSAVPSRTLGTLGTLGTRSALPRHMWWSVYSWIGPEEGYATHGMARGMDRTTRRVACNIRHDVQALIQALAKFEGGLLVVSHDEYLINAVCDELWVLRDCKVSSYPSGLFLPVPPTLHTCCTDTGTTHAQRGHARAKARIHNCMVPGAVGRAIDVTLSNRPL